jgi:hypothetical protein
VADFTDDLSKDIAAAMAAPEAPAGASSGPPSDAPATPPPAAPADKTGEVAGGERARTETGQFAKKPATAEKPVETAPAPQARAPSQPQATVPPVAKIAPPPNWKGNGKVAWDRLPDPIKKEISDDYSHLSQTDGELSRLKAAIGDRAQLLAANYGSVEQGLQNLFAISDLATKNPAGFIQWFSQQRGIDLRQLIEGVQGQPQQQPQDAQHPLVQEVLSLRNTVQQMIQQQQLGQTSQLQAEIDDFSNDTAHPYFNDVKADMAALLGAGRAKNLQEAYDMAVWAHPDVRQSLIAKERETAMNANAAKVAQAKNAAGLTGSPTGAQVPPDDPNETLDDTIRRAIAQRRV